MFNGIFTIITLPLEDFFNKATELRKAMLYCTYNSTFLQGSSVPFGSQGTVVGILSGKVDVLFDLEFNSGYKIRWVSLLGCLASHRQFLNQSIISNLFVLVHIFLKTILSCRGAMNSGACVPKTSLINITYGKERKGRNPEEIPAGTGGRLSAGKDNVSSKQKVFGNLQAENPCEIVAVFCFVL